MKSIWTLWAPGEIQRQLQITLPGDGNTFICLNRETIIRPPANYPGNLLWFLNGKLVDNSSVRSQRPVFLQQRLQIESFAHRDCLPVTTAVFLCNGYHAGEYSTVANACSV